MSFLLCSTLILHSISIFLNIYSIFHMSPSILPSNSLSPRTFLYIQPFPNFHALLPSLCRSFIFSPSLPPFLINSTFFRVPVLPYLYSLYRLTFAHAALPTFHSSFRLFLHFVLYPLFPLFVIRHSLFPGSIRSRTGHVLGDSSSTAEIFSPCNFAVGRGNDGNYGTTTVETPFRVRYLARFTGISRQADFPSAWRWIGKMAGIPKSRRAAPRWWPAPDCERPPSSLGLIGVRRAAARKKGLMKFFGWIMGDEEHFVCA